ncbi:Nicotianamine synthase [Aaosphaeria arxii CBS 175.79]|uniref:Nicotianamine synthase n=1 Tax=Aaosphaeria arxii CBS 175.79 TaxID=1450172 RepID=A0A6A5XLU2_9PLEO|nr:Nicotianamine synthase [Aaosphaeria arxii CBS 175.79]KAF2013923.1 Nicotianamine synthase [Aaosphaeria arxii CBS 175.79]
MATQASIPSTPTGLIDEVRRIYHEVQALSSLAPGKEIDALLTRLVHLCIQPYSDDFIAKTLSSPEANELCLSLRPLCAAAEGELEKYWANRILASAAASSKNGTTTTTTPRTLLHSFPYFDNYLDLSRLECSVLEAFLPTCGADCRPSPCKLAFVGSGPMPLTSFCMLDRYPDAVVHNIDRDAGALRVSRELSEKCGYGGRMTFACEDVSEEMGGEGATRWRDFHVVFLAALVGMDTPSKMTIMESLVRKLEPGTLLVVRSAQGMRGVLYPVLELSEDLQRIGLTTLLVAHPWTKVVNSVVVLRVN